MLTFFLIFVVLLINLFVYGLDSPQNYGVVSHLYYGVIIPRGYMTTVVDSICCLGARH